MNGPNSLEGLVWDTVETYKTPYKYQVIKETKPINRKNPLFILEGRKRNRKDRYIPNTTQHIIGIFTSYKNAQNWIKTEGQDFYYNNHKSHRDNFYALVKINSFNIMDGILETFFDKKGNAVK